MQRAAGATHRIAGHPEIPRSHDLLPEMWPNLSPGTKAAQFPGRQSGRRLFRDNVCPSSLDAGAFIFIFFVCGYICLSLRAVQRIPLTVFLLAPTHDKTPFSPPQYPALKPKKKLRLQPYVPRVFGYKIRQEDADKQEPSGAAALANSLAGANGPSKVSEENDVLRSENASLKARLLQLENSLK
jgi:hypothetical protein